MCRPSKPFIDSGSVNDDEMSDIDTDTAYRQIDVHLEDPRDMSPDQRVFCPSLRLRQLLSLEDHCLITATGKRPPARPNTVILRAVIIWKHECKACHSFRCLQLFITWVNDEGALSSFADRNGGDNSTHRNETRVKKWKSTGVYHCRCKIRILDIRTKRRQVLDDRLYQSTGIFCREQGGLKTSSNICSQWFWFGSRYVKTSNVAFEGSSTVSQTSIGP